MPLVHRLDVAVAAPQRDALQHVRPPWWGVGGIWFPELLRSPHRRMKVGIRGGYVVGEGLLLLLLLDQTTRGFSRLTGAGGRNPLRKEIIPRSRSGAPGFGAGRAAGWSAGAVPASPTPELRQAPAGTPARGNIPQLFFFARSSVGWLRYPMHRRPHHPRADATLHGASLTACSQRPSCAETLLQVCVT